MDEREGSGTLTPTMVCLSDLLSDVKHYGLRFDMKAFNWAPGELEVALRAALLALHTQHQRAQAAGSEA